MSSKASTRVDVRRDARVLIVGGGPFQLDAIRAAKRVAREVWVVDRDARAPGMTLADRSVAFDFGDVDRVVELARRERFDGVVTAASDAAVSAVAACVEEFGLAGLDRATAARCRDKLESQRALSRAGLRVPDTREAKSLSEVHSAIEWLGGLPAVLKPRSAAGGRGVTIVKQRGEVAAAFERAMGYARADQSCLVQEWVSTESVGLEAFLWDGEIVAAFCLSDQYQDGFVSPIGHALPSGLDETTRLRVLAAAGEFCRALGLRAGPFNFDLRVGPRDVCMIEVNARLGGNSITPLIRTALGIDLSEAAVVAALGENPALELQARHAPVACATRLIVDRDGLAAASRYTPLAGVPSDAVTVELLANAGQQAVRVDDWVILGHCLARSSSAESAIVLARRACDSVLGRAIAPVPA